MNGAESLVRTLLAVGVDTCFANPGASEMHFVAASDRHIGTAKSPVTWRAVPSLRVAKTPHSSPSGVESWLLIVTGGDSPKVAARIELRQAYPTAALDDFTKRFHSD